MFFVVSFLIFSHTITVTVRTIKVFTVRDLYLVMGILTFIWMRSIIV